MKCFVVLPAEDETENTIVIVFLVLRLANGTDQLTTAQVLPTKWFLGFEEVCSERGRAGTEWFFKVADG